VFLNAFKRLFKKPDPVTRVSDLLAYNGQQQFSPWEHSIYDGGKYAGGFGPTQVQYVDYWTLRARSSQLYNENLYARGLIRRLVTNEINTGLTPESCPEESIIGLPEDSLVGWTDLVETRFGIWAKSPQVCDWKKELTFGRLQQLARLEALVNGDCLVVLRMNPATGAPSVQLISGNVVQTPLTANANNVRAGNKIVHGIEIDPRGRKVAYWVTQDDGTSKRLPAFGEKSGRRIAWMVYGTDKRLDDMRGQPLLALVLQSLKEIDRYRDSVQRKAVINSILAMFIEKTQDKPSSLPVTGGAVRNGTATATDADGTTRDFNFSKHIPGLIFQELQAGEKPVSFGSTGTDTSFGVFEEAIIQSVAWANEIPPEIVRLAFSNNYSASQAAINEFKIYLNKVWSDFGEGFCSPIYSEWLVNEALTQKIQAPGLLEAWRDPAQYDILGSWMLVDWYGSIKPSTDMLKQAKGSKMLVEEGWSTNARESRITTGTKFSRNIKRLRRENEQKAEAIRPLLELRSAATTGGAEARTSTDDIEALIQEAIREPD